MFQGKLMSRIVGSTNFITTQKLKLEYIPNKQGGTEGKGERNFGLDITTHFEIS